MIDIKLLRQDPEFVLQQLRRRGYKLNLDYFQQLETDRRNIQQITEQLQSKRNQLAKSIGIAKSAGKPFEELLNESVQVNEQLIENEKKLNELQQKLMDFQLDLPNLLHESIPPGESDFENDEIRRWGTPKTFEYIVRDHVDLGESLEMMDFAAAAKLSGSRFVVLKRGLAQLQRALAQFMLDVHVRQHGYEEVYVPYIVHANMLIGTGQLPKFAQEQFRIEGEEKFSLIPTAEVPIANLARDRVFEEHELPKKWVGHTPCFRREAGSYGKDTRGMIRQHQFEKVELVQIVKPDGSYQALEELIAHAEKILQLLELPYRVMLLCAGDTGFAAAKTYDLEVWLPSQEKYREVSSCSNCEAFQARRMQTRWRSAQMKKPEPVHTLNGSGLAIGRTLVAIMENYQDEKGRIYIPEVLKPYMNYMDVIE